MTEIRVPKLNANDVSYVLVEWLAADGAALSVGEPVAVVETSKAAEELLCEHDGYLRRVLVEGAECGAGEVIGHLVAAIDDTVPTLSPALPAPPPPGTSLIITDPARTLMVECGVTEDRVRALGRRVIRRVDVEELLAKPPAADPPSGRPPAVQVPGGRRVELTRSQRTVAAVVAESHRTIPAAFVAVSVRVDAALTFGRDLSRRCRCLIGLPELVVRAVAAQFDEFPLCFGTMISDGLVELPDVANVGVTIDTGTGLHVPVVRAAAQLSWRDLGRAVMRFRVTAMRGGFRSGELAGGNIVVALHNDADVTVAVPIVFPGQTCAVSLGAVQSMLILEGGRPVEVRTVQLGLAYDHRVLNGRDAVLFLRAVKELLETPGNLDDAAASPHPFGHRPD